MLFGCDASDNPFAYKKNARGRGKAMIMVDESFKPLFDTSIRVFESQFPNAHVVPVYSGESEILSTFYEGKVRTIAISRDFTSKERATLKKMSLEPRSEKIAIDAVALIVHPDNKDTLMDVETLKQILTADNSSWPSTGKSMKIVFDRINSANFNYLLDLTQSKTLSKNVFAVKSNKQVIDYVKKNKDAIGVIGLNWISDEEDFEALNFLDGIQVMAVAKKKGGEYLRPYAGYLWTKEYALTREIWISTIGGKMGLHAGFIAFMFGEKGQLLVQKSELVPARAPIRLMQITTE